MRRLSEGSKTQKYESTLQRVVKIKNLGAYENHEEAYSEELEPSGNQRRIVVFFVVLHIYPVSDAVILHIFFFLGTFFILMLDEEL